MITRSCRAPTPAERLADYYTNPAAIERRVFKVWPWQKRKQAKGNVTEITQPRRKRA